MKVYDSYITINIDSKKKKCLIKLPLERKKLSRMIYEEYIKSCWKMRMKAKREESYNQYQEVIKDCVDIIQKEHKEMYGIVVFSQDNFDKQYSKKAELMYSVIIMKHF